MCDVVCGAVDVTTYHRGFHGDLNETMFVGAVSDKAKLLVQTTHECLARAIAAGTQTLSLPSCLLGPLQLVLTHSLSLPSCLLGPLQLVLTHSLSLPSCLLGPLQLVLTHSLSLSAIMLARAIAAGTQTLSLCCHTSVFDHHQLACKFNLCFLSFIVHTNCCCIGPTQSSTNDDWYSGC